MRPLRQLPSGGGAARGLGTKTAAGRSVGAGVGNRASRKGGPIANRDDGGARRSAEASLATGGVSIHSLQGERETQSFIDSNPGNRTVEEGAG